MVRKQKRLCQIKSVPILLCWRIKFHTHTVQFVYNIKSTFIIKILFNYTENKTRIMSENIY